MEWAVEMSLHEEVPIEPELKNWFDLPAHRIKNTGRRFNRYQGKYVEVSSEKADHYDVAQFGECVLGYEHGTHRINQVTVIYARMMKFRPMEQ